MHYHVVDGVGVMVDVGDMDPVGDVEGVFDGVIEGVGVTLGAKKELHVISTAADE
jgi:hypothetical protein